MTHGEKEARWYPKVWKGRKKYYALQIQWNSEWLKQREEAKWYGEISKKRDWRQKMEDIVNFAKNPAKRHQQATIPVF